MLCAATLMYFESDLFRRDILSLPVRRQLPYVFRLVGGTRLPVGRKMVAYLVLISLSLFFFLLTRYIRRDKPTKPRNKELEEDDEEEDDELQPGIPKKA